RGGQTVGMRPWRIRLTRRDGGAPTFQQAVLRLLVAAAPMLVLMLAPVLGLRTTLWALLLVWAAWFAVALVDPRRRALHDIVAATELRRIG
ncbi:MAG TPA: RDD family protein, partial [Rhodanobacter sp.]|nr:RDD family protein [Rhodanobacter sp.]